MSSCTIGTPSSEHNPQVPCGLPAAGISSHFPHVVWPRLSGAKRSPQILQVKVVWPMNFKFLAVRQTIQYFVLLYLVFRFLGQSEQVISIIRPTTIAYPLSPSQADPLLSPLGDRGWGIAIGVISLRTAILSHVGHGHRLGACGPQHRNTLASLRSPKKNGTVRGRAGRRPRLAPRRSCVACYRQDPRPAPQTALASQKSHLAFSAFMCRGHGNHSPCHKTKRCLPPTRNTGTQTHMLMFPCGCTSGSACATRHMPTHACTRGHKRGCLRISAYVSRVQP
jgi:hypothetical protein